MPTVPKIGPRRQHLVSNFYLKHFADDQQRINVFDLRHQRTWNSKTKDAMVENHIYTLPTDAPDLRYALENALGEIETDAAPVIQTVVDQQNLTGIRRDLLALWMAAQLKRSSLIGDHIKQVNLLMSDPCVGLQIVENNRGALIRKFGEKAVEEYVIRIRKGESAASLSTGQTILFGLEKIGMYATSICEMHWTLEVSRSEGFLTSDNPVFVRRRGISKDHYLVGVARKDLDAELHFPISPTLFLIGKWRRSRESKRRVSTWRVRELNRMTILCSNRQIAYSPKTELDKGLIDDCASFRLNIFDVPGFVDGFRLSN